jgi:ABC-type antimicrobial peptide transport system permease subunit
MVAAHPLFRRNVAEHVTLLLIGSSHAHWTHCALARYNISDFFSSLLGLFLSCIGVYGTMAYRVSRRTHEIGVRLALGARESDVLWLVTKECLILVVVGLVTGVPIALASTRMIASQLFGIGATDPLTLAVAAVLLVLAALGASYVPARRATRVDPMVALRYE